MVRVAERSLCKRMIRGELRKNDSFLMCVFFFLTFCFYFSPVSNNEQSFYAVSVCVYVCVWVDANARKGEREGENGCLHVCAYVCECISYCRVFLKHFFFC